MNINKSYDFFKPEDLKSERIHIIGCGAVGSTVAEMLTRFGITDITLWDFDKVESKNIANQMFRDKDIGKYKVDALAEIMREVNPDFGDNLITVNTGWEEGDPLTGYVFLCVDNIDLRRAIAQDNQYNPDILGMFDIRMALTDAQGHATEWTPDGIRKFLKTMNFTHEEAADETPRSACNEVLSICPTVRIICAMQVMNFINYIKGAKLKRLLLTNVNSLTAESF